MLPATVGYKYCPTIHAANPTDIKIRGTAPPAYLHYFISRVHKFSKNVGATSKL
jgi:hypothetical protein